jgi:serine/threonine protein kinase
MEVSHDVDLKYIENRYIDRKKLGQGSYGSVYKTYDTLLKTYVALKEQGPSNFKQMKEEIESHWPVWSQMKHPNVVTIYDYWIVEESRFVYVVMEYIDGLSFQELKFRPVGPENMFLRLQQTINPRAELDRIWRTASQIVKGLNYLHRHDIAHRDIKPGNIVQRSSTEEAVLVDFDFFCIAKEKVTRGNERLKCKDRGVERRIGTRIFEAPEYLIGEKIDNEMFLKNDIWCVGSSLYNYYFDHFYIQNYDTRDMQKIAKMLQIYQGQIIRKPANRFEQYINYLMNVNYKERPTSVQALKMIYSAST